MTRKAPPELDDPNGHFPYKADAARDALAATPDPDTNNHPESWYTSEGIIAASQRYVQAQADYLTNPGDGTRELMDQAAADLVEARREHRAGRSGVGAQAGHPVQVVWALHRQGGRSAEQVAEHLGMPLDEVRSILDQPGREG